MKQFLRSIRRSAGFTLMELLVVMTIIGILAAIAVPSYQRSLIRAREAVLMEDLYQIRRAIDAHFADKAKYPDSLEGLVEARYLRGLPVDPFTREADWECLPPEAPVETEGEGEPAAGGCADVHSVSDVVGLNGIPYSEW